jgi:hypothetical protein
MNVMRRAMFIHKQKGPLIMMVFFLFTGIFSVPMDVLIMDNEQQEPEEAPCAAKLPTSSVTP